MKKRKSAGCVGAPQHSIRVGMINADQVRERATLYQAALSSDKMGSGEVFNALSGTPFFHGKSTG